MNTDIFEYVFSFRSYPSARCVSPLVFSVDVRFVVDNQMLNLVLPLQVYSDAFSGIEIV